MVAALLLYNSVKHQRGGKTITHLKNAVDLAKTTIQA